MYRKDPENQSPKTAEKIPPAGDFELVMCFHVLAITENLW